MSDRSFRRLNQQINVNTNTYDTSKLFKLTVSYTEAACLQLPLISQGDSNEYNDENED